MTTRTKIYSIDEMLAEIKKLVCLQMEQKERALVEIITKYDFIVGSEECKFKLMEALPKGTNIIYSPYIESPTTIYAIKKFDIMNLWIEPPESENKKKW